MTSTSGYNRHMTRIRFQVHLDPKPFAALQRIHEETGAPVAELIRRAVDAWLKTQQVSKKGKR
jgi:hypothetical protein